MMNEKDFSGLLQGVKEMAAHIKGQPVAGAVETRIKAGALLERGVDRAVGECGIIGTEAGWITDPSQRRARAKLQSAQGGRHG